MKSLLESTDDEEFRRFCELVKDNFTYPVDELIISPELELIGERDVSHCFDRKNLVPGRGYIDFFENPAEENEN